MKKIVYSIVLSVVKFLYSGKIIGKPLKDYKDTMLYYQMDQHLTFVGSSSISYEPFIAKYLQKFIKPNDIIFDIGCNIGQYMTLFSNWVPTGKVYSFEPDPSTYAFANFNKEINQLSNVVILNEGVGDTYDELEFFKDSKTGGRRGSFEKKYVRDSYTGKSVKVKTRPFKDLVEKYGVPNFVKIDVEGFEDKVIEGIGEPSPKTIFFIEVRTESKDMVYNFFNSRQFDCEILLDNKSEKIKSATEIPNFANLLFIHNS